MKVSLLLLLAMAPDNGVVTLQQLRARALGARPELSLHDARLAQASAKIDEAKAAQRPQVAGRLEALASPGSELIRVENLEGVDRSDPTDRGDEFIVGGSKTISDGSEAFEPQARYSAQVGVEWTVWDFGRSAAAIGAARAERRAREAEAAQTRDALVRAVDEVYLEWLGAVERAKFEAGAVRRYLERRTDLKERAAAGTLAPSAVLPLNADVASARLRESYADSAVRLARLAVEEAIGGALAPNATPDPHLLTMGAPTATAAADRSAGSAGSDDPADRALGARVQAARQLAELHDKRYLPQLKAAVSAGIRGQSLTVFPFYAATIGLDFPLYDGGSGSARAEAARADARALMSQREQRRSKRDRARTRQEIRLEQAQHRVALAERLVAATRAHLKDVLQRYADAAANSSELTQAHAAEAQSESQLLTAKLDRARAALALRR